jgi:hypothetical protein
VNILRNSRRASDWKKTLAATAGLLALTIIFFWKLCLTSEYVWFDHPDMCFIEIPRLQFQAREFHLGRFPLWDPNQWLGQPLIGQAQPGPLYPFNLLFFLMPLQDGLIDFRLLNWYFVLTRFVAALCMYALCRDLRISRGVSVVAAAGFGFGGFVGSVAWLDVVNGAVWTPAVCLFLLRAMRGIRPLASAAYCGAFLGLTWFSGHHEIPMLVGLSAGVAWIYAIFRMGRAAVAPAAVTFAIAGLVGAAQIWPTLEYGLLSMRWIGLHDPVGWNARIPYIIPSTYSLAPGDLLGLVLPLGRSQADSTAFLGLTVVTMAAFAIMTRWRIPPVRWFLALSVLAVLYSLGAATPLHGVLYTLVPGLGKARIPVRAIHLLNMGVVMLAAYGMDRLLDRSRHPALRGIVLVLYGSGIILIGVFALFRADANHGFVLTGTVALALAMVLSARRLSRTGVLVALLVLMFVELNGIMTRTFASRFDKNANKFVASLRDFRDVAEFLHHEPAPRRVAVNESDIPTNFGDWYGIDMVEGYSAGVTSNLLRLERHLPRMQDLLGVTHYIAREPNRPGQIDAFEGEKGVKVFRNPTAFPRVWSVHSVESVPSDAHLRIRLQDPEYDPRRTALMLGSTPVLESCDGDSMAVLARAPNRVRVRADMKCRGLVVASETFYPGWQATIDGRESPIIEAYGALRGLVVPEGKHEIVFTYRPLSVFGGAALTFAGLILTALIGFGSARARSADSRNPSRYRTGTDEPSRPLDPGNVTLR